MANTMSDDEEISRIVKPSVAHSNLNTVHVAETASLALLRMMQTTSPIDGNVALLSVEPCSAFHGSTGTDATELEKTIEYRAVIADVVLGLLAHVTVHIVWRNPPKKFDVLVGVKLGHFVDNGGFRALQEIRRVNTMRS